MSYYVADSRNWTKVLEGWVNEAVVNPLVVNGLVAACLTLLFTVSDAFETGHLAMSHQITLWLTFSALLVSQLYFLHKALLAKLSSSFLFRVLAIGLAVAATVLLMTIELHLFKYTPLLLKQPDPFLEFLAFIAKPVVAASALVLMSQLIPIQQQINAHQKKALQALKQSSNPEELSSIAKAFTVQHVHAHDHYLEVSCVERRFFLRGRMKDAIEVLVEADGLQIHRSHWVARQAIQRTVRAGRDIKLVLADGTEVPVARSRTHLLNDEQ